MFPTKSVTDWVIEVSGSDSILYQKAVTLLRKRYSSIYLKKETPKDILFSSVVYLEKNYYLHGSSLTVYIKLAHCYSVLKYSILAQPRRKLSCCRLFKTLNLRSKINGVFELIENIFRNFYLTDHYLPRFCLILIYLLYFAYGITEDKHHPNRTFGHKETKKTGSETVFLKKRATSCLDLTNSLELYFRSQTFFDFKIT